MVGQRLYAHVTLEKGERSELAELASVLLCSRLAARRGAKMAGVKLTISGAAPSAKVLGGLWLRARGRGTAFG